MITVCLEYELCSYRSACKIEQRKSFYFRRYFRISFDGLSMVVVKENEETHTPEETAVLEICIALN